MYLALREIRHAKLRFALVVTIMLLVSFLVLFITGLARGLAYDTTSALETMKADHFVLEKGADNRFGRSLLTGNELDAAQEVVGSDKALPLAVRMSTVSIEGAAVKKDVTLFTVDADSWLLPDVMEGSTITSTSEGHVLADKKLKSAGAEVGTVLKDPASGMSWTISGFVDQSAYSHTPVVFLNQKDGAKLRAAFRSQASTQTDSYNVIAVQATKEQVHELAQRLPETDIIPRQDAIDAIPGYSEEQGSFTLMIAFLYVIAAFVLAVFFYVITLQKLSQFGILKAIGARTGTLAAGLIVQVLLLSVGSAGISLLLVRFMMQALPDTMPFRLGTATMLLTAGAFVLVAVLGSLLSIGKVARTDALEAIGGTAG
ncbi:ABC transporter permease [Gorillibacterium sp. CAU 1737]